VADQDVITKLAILEKDISQISMLFEKLDVTIDKLSQVSSQINQLLAVHDEKIERSIKIEQEIFKLLESRRIEVNEKFDSIRKQMAEDSRIHSKEHAELDVRLKNLEMWRWMVVGASAVVGFVLSKINLPFFK
jgi:hypothetical protein